METELPLELPPTASSPAALQEEPPGYGGGAGGAAPADPVADYLRSVERDLVRGDATEHTHRRALQELLEALEPEITALNEPRRAECGAPDYMVRRRRDGLLIGYIEAKSVGANLDEIETSDQLRRYCAAQPNVLLTDYLEFRWLVDAQRRETFRLATRGPEGRLAAVSTEEQARAVGLLRAFLTRAPVPVATADELARRLAHLAHAIRLVLAGAFQTGHASQQLRDWRDAFARTLLPELAPQADPKREAAAVAEFADMFAQTLAYGLFSARAVCGAARFTRETARKLVPRTNPFLRAFFEQITGTALDDEPFAGLVEDLIQTLQHADMARILEDFGRRGPRRDPVVHFYETFLQAYDPKLREVRGVYYTPEPVVHYIVESVDGLLRERFGLKDGLADRSKITLTRREGEREVTEESHRVLILDPAAGTATFLYAVLDFIRAQFKRRRNAGQWASYVHEHLLPRLFGFELLMAPYAVAHFKLGLALAAMDEEPLFRPQWSYEPRPGERLNIFLTNTLEEAERRVEMLGPLRALSDEANAAADIKARKPVLVVLGNPPYSGHSANRGEWIARLVREYHFCDGRPLGERNPKWLQDDYVKFIRWGQWRIEQTGQGILAFITNHGYLDNPTFRGMRQHLMRSFDEIYLLDLHGNAKKKETVPDTGEPDKNVFDIQQGVAIGIFVKWPEALRAKKKKGDLAVVHHAHLWGAQRQRKYEWLERHHVRNTRWTVLEPSAPHYLFIPQSARRRREYERGWKITEMMPVHSLGITAGRDHFTIAFTREELRRRLIRFVTLAPESARLEFGLGPDSRDWKVELAQRDLQRNPSPQRIRPILYRPFDVRFTCYSGVSRGFHCMARHDVMRHFLPPSGNLGLSTTRSVEIRTGWHHVFATTTLIQLHSVSLKEVNYLFPLYLYSNGKLPEQELFPHHNERRPNFSAAFIAELCERLGVRFVPEGHGRPAKHEVGPEDVFAYAYAIFHSPTYRQRYAEFLRADFPRVPLTSRITLFRALARLGERLVELHARDGADPDAVRFPVKGSDRVEAVHYQPPKRGEPGRVWINATQFFEGVPEAAWNFPIGGYQPAQRWLKDRVGRTLNHEELAAYQRLVSALAETQRLMGDVDACIEKDGGWPLE
ncbi:MAG: N-6 DNA methylase [Verrucomicrobiae bacterium]|nr:N-6 DNA methylase [Verrucomicrobiae bacterium]